MDVGDDAVINRYGFDVLIEVLRGRGLRTIGPVVRDGAIVHGDIGTSSDLPEGFHDHTEPGKYRLSHDGGTELFGWAVGPASWKSEFFVPTETVWRAEVAEGGGVTLSEPPEEPLPVALVGARPCEVAALGILDRVLRDGKVPDDRYAARRDGAFLVAVECGTPSSTCFCTSMGTGPAAAAGYDLALTEVAGPVDGERGTTSGSVRPSGPRSWPRFPAGPPTTACARVAGRSSTGLPNGWAAPSTPRASPRSWPGISSTRAGERWPSAVCRAATALSSAPPVSAATSRTSPT